eukprot:6175865-Pleurochrysis_carterae.AAC.3
MLMNPQTAASTSDMPSLQQSKIGIFRLNLKACYVWSTMDASSAAISDVAEVISAAMQKWPTASKS